MATIAGVVIVPGDQDAETASGRSRERAASAGSGVGFDYNLWVMNQDQDGSPRLTGALNIGPTCIAGPRASHTDRLV